MDVELGTWKMYFNEAANQYGNGIGILLFTPKGSYIPLAIKLNFEATNNVAEYKAFSARIGAYPDGADKRVCCSIRMIATQYIPMWRITL